MLSLQKNKIFFMHFLAIIVGLCLSWKLIRLTSLTSIQPYVAEIWNIHGLFIAISFLVSLGLVIFKKFSIQKSDIVIISILLLFLFSVIINQTFVNVRFYSNFILPAAMYFIGVYLSKYYSDKNDCYQFIDSLFLFLIIISFIDFLDLNFTNQIIFNYRFGYDVSQLKLISLNNLYFRTLHSFFNFVVFRPVGISMVVHASAALAAGFFLYFGSRCVSIYQNKLHRRLPLVFLGLLLSATHILLISVGTAYLIILLAAPFILKNKYNKIISFILMIICILAIWKTRSYLPIEHMLTETVNTLKTLDQHWIKYLLFGSTSMDSDTYFQSEIYFFTLVFVIGIFATVIFSFLNIYVLYKTYSASNPNLTPLALVIFSLFIGNIHYNTLFIYPNSVIYFIIIGYLNTEIGRNA